MTPYVRSDGEIQGSASPPEYENRTY